MPAGEFSSLIDVACTNMVPKLSSSLLSSGSSDEVSCKLTIRSKVDIACNTDDLFFVNSSMYCGVGPVGGCKPSIMSLVSLDSLFQIL